MVSQLSRVFTALNNNGREDYNLPLPMINTISNNFSSYLNAVNQISKKINLMQIYKNRAELTGLINKVARDIVSDYEFRPIRKGSIGQKDIKRAKQFAAENYFDKTLFSQAIDMLVTGESFGLPSKLPQSEVNKVVKKTIGSVQGLETKETKELIGQIQQKLDEDALLLRRLRHVASSSIEVMFNQYEVESYVQIVGAKKTNFSKEELIHFTLMDVDGRPNGFTPVESIITQVELLRQMWGNMLSIQKNGGSPDRFVIAKNVHPDSPSFKKIEENLRKYKLMQNKHGSLLLTGDVKIENLQQLDKMQFMDSGLYITGLIAMQWSIPRSSIPFIVGGTNTSDDSGGNSERDYWANIEFSQQVFAAIYNEQFWKKYFNVELVFTRKYKQGEIREETLKQMKFDNIARVENSLMKIGKRLSDDKLFALLGLNEDDVETLEIPTEPDNSGFNQRNQSDDDLETSDGEKNKRKKKVLEQANGFVNRGDNNGQGKEFNLVFKQFDKRADLEFKQLISADLVDVPFDKFVTLYGQDKQMGVRPPRLFVKISEQYVSMWYKSTDFTYKTGMTKLEFQDKEVAMFNLQGNMYEV